MKVYESHGHSRGRKRTPTYQAWQNMRSRCGNPNRGDYKYYGGRGINVCKEWLNSFATFLRDMGERPNGMSLDRENNFRNYSKSNCRWATKEQQMQNTRTNVSLTLNSVTLVITAWARKLGMNHGAIQGRLKRGWTIERALTQPKRHENRN